MKIKYLLYFLYLLISPLLILAILILYKFNIIIRIVPLITDRIGHFASNTAIYYFSKENLNRKSNFKFIDFVFFEKRISNNFLAHKIKNKLKISNRYLCYTIYFILKLLSKKFNIFNLFYYDNYPLKIRDTNNYIENNTQFIQLNKTEIEKGYNFLQSLGIQKNQKYICLIARDEAYLSDLQEEYSLKKNSFRNIDIDKFELFAKKFTEKGYFVIRMGKKVSKPFNLANKNPKIIDYPYLKNKSDFFDIFLISESFFCISSGCGLDELAVIFKKPLALIEPQISKYRSYNSKIMHIFRRYINISNQKILNLKNIIDNEVSLISSGLELDRKKILISQPDQADIFDLATDLENYIINNYKFLDENELKIQKKFNSHYKQKFNNNFFKDFADSKVKQNWQLNQKEYIGLISPKYLTKNKWLFD